MWLALSLKKEAEVGFLGRSTKMPFSSMADGCVGCLLVFDDKDSAVEYVGDGGKIVEVEFDIANDGGEQK